MPDLTEAIIMLRRYLPPPKTETVTLQEALGRVAAADLFAPEDLPHYDRSAMDGYAVRSEDISSASRDNPVILTVIDVLQAGCLPRRPLGAGEAVAVATGAPIPEGADAVVRVEDTRPVTQSGNSRFVPVGGQVAILASVPKGKNISPKGEDVQRGEKIVFAGEKLTPAHIGLLASCGFWKISVLSKPKAAVIPTGNELVSIEATPSIGQIRNSTVWAVAAALKECGVEPSVFEPVPDELDILTARLSEAIDNFDLVVTCGGVSVGQSDLVREAWKQLGAQILFWNLPLRPGKSVLAATCCNKLAIGLSGNPSAALTTFDLLLRPLICDWTGTREGLLVETEAALTETVQQMSGFLKALRVKLMLNGNQLMAQPTKGQLNTVLSSLARSDGYALIPPGKGEIHAGTVVKVLARKERLTSAFKLADKSQHEILSEKVRTDVM